MRWLLPILLAGMALSGCFNGDDDGNGDGTTTPAPTTSAPATTTGQPTTPPPASPTTPAPTGPRGVNNRLPIGSINGTVLAAGPPVEVGFLLKGTDADRDELSWNLDYGDGNSTNGTDLPAAVEHLYNETSVFLATYNLTDGEATVTYYLLLDLRREPVPIATVAGNTTQGGNPLTSGAFGASGCAGFNAGENEVDCVYGELDLELEGHPFVFNSTVPAPDYELWDACDPISGGPVQVAGGDPVGELPQGAGCVIMWNFDDAETGEFRFDVF